MKNAKYDQGAITKALEFFEAMKDAKKAMKRYEEVTGCDSPFWKVPDYVQDSYECAMEAFGKLLK